MNLFVTEQYTILLQDDSEEKQALVLPDFGVEPVDEVPEQRLESVGNHDEARDKGNRVGGKSEFFLLIHEDPQSADALEPL